MPTGAAVSGIGAVSGGGVKVGATTIAEVKNWSFNPKSNNPAYSSNKTGGYKERVAGVKDGSGSLEGVWDPADMFIAVIDVGTEVTLDLFITATQKFVVPAIIDDYDFTVDMDEGEIVGWTANFSTNGAWTNPVSAITLPEGVEFPVPEEEWENMLNNKEGDDFIITREAETEGEDAEGGKKLVKMKISDMLQKFGEELTEKMFTKLEEKFEAFRAEEKVSEERCEPTEERQRPIGTAVKSADEEQTEDSTEF